MIEELLEDIQTYLSVYRETSDECREYEQLLEEFYQVPSYVERFKHDDAQDHIV